MNKKYIGIILGVLLVIGIGAYFISIDFLKNRQLEQAQKCSSDGVIFFKQYQIVNNYQGLLWDTPQYYYNKKLNTCLVYLRTYISTGFYGSVHDNNIIDIYKNKVLVRGYFSRTVGDNGGEVLLQGIDSSVPNYLSLDFFKKKEEIFSE